MFRSKALVETLLSLVRLKVIAMMVLLLPEKIKIEDMQKYFIISMNLGTKWEIPSEESPAVICLDSQCLSAEMDKLLQLVLKIMRGVLSNPAMFASSTSPIQYGNKIMFFPTAQFS